MPARQHDTTGSNLEPVVGDAVRAAGFDLERLEVSRAGRRQLVRVVVDSDHGVGLDEIAMVSRAVSAVLDTQDHLLVGPYTLEVTSPGVDALLTHPRHWRRSHLRRVQVRLADGAQLAGRVGAADGSRVQLLVDGRLRELRYDDVERAQVEVEFRPPPEHELAALREAALERDGAGTDPEEGQ